MCVCVRVSMLVRVGWVHLMWWSCEELRVGEGPKGRRVRAMGGPYGTVYAPFSSRPFQSGPFWHQRVHKDTCRTLARRDVGHHFRTSTRGVFGGVPRHRTQ